MPAVIRSGCESVKAVVAEHLTFDIVVECLLDEEGLFTLWQSKTAKRKLESLNWLRLSVMS